MATADEGHPRQTAIVAAARGYVGVRFRLQGRDHHGLDCLGLVLLCGRAAGLRIDAPADYLMRGHDRLRIEDSLRSQGFRELRDGVAGVGDLLVRFPSGCQAHFAVRTDLGLVEAHAGLRRVVERPMGADGPCWRAWRFPVGGA